MRRWIVLVGATTAGLYLYFSRRGAEGTEGRDTLYWDSITRRPRTAPEVGALVNTYLSSVPDPPTAKESAVMSFFMPIERAGAAFRLEPALIAAVIDRESAGDPLARGPVGEYGLMQVRPTTADMMYDIGVYKGDRRNLLDPGINIHYGAAYLRWQMDKHKSKMLRVMWAVAGYNAGTAQYDSTTRKFKNQKYVEAVVNVRLPRYAYLFNQVYRAYGRP